MILFLKMIERNLIFLPLMGFTRNTEGELIFQSLKKIVYDDHLSQNVLGGLSRMLDLKNSNSTHNDTRAAVVVNTTVKPDVLLLLFKLFIRFYTY